jgi:hypothetical protein
MRELMREPRRICQYWPFLHLLIGMSMTRVLISSSWATARHAAKLFICSSIHGPARVAAKLGSIDQVRAKLRLILIVGGEFKVLETPQYPWRRSRVAGVTHIPMYGD